MWTMLGEVGSGTLTTNTVDHAGSNQLWAAPRENPRHTQLRVVVMPDEQSFSAWDSFPLPCIELVRHCPPFYHFGGGHSVWGATILPIFSRIEQCLSA